MDIDEQIALRAKREQAEKDAVARRAGCVTKRERQIRGKNVAERQQAIVDFHKLQDDDFVRAKDEDEEHRKHVREANKLARDHQRTCEEKLHRTILKNNPYVTKMNETQLTQARESQKLRETQLQSMRAAAMQVSTRLVFTK